MINRKRTALRKLSTDACYSFNVKVDKGERLLNELHYHPELELILLKKSAGKAVIGNSVRRFEDNELLLLGSDLPHLFIHDDFPMDGSFPMEKEALVIQFDQNFLGEKFMNLPELKPIQELFQLAKQGIRISEQVKHQIIPLLEKMHESTSLSRIIALLEILNLLVENKSYDLLGNEACTKLVTGDKDERLKKIIRYTNMYYQSSITIEEVAAEVNLTRGAFCRFFKAHTGKTYFEYLIEFRISKACRYLLESEMNIKEIGYNVGYENLSHFHCQFRRTMKMSPLEFRSRSLISHDR